MSMRHTLPNFDTITVEVTGEFATDITLSRPARRNALSHRMMLELMSALQLPAVRRTGVVLRGDGTVFCAGADLEELDRIRAASDAPARAREVSTLAQSLMRAIESHPLPVIACVQGAAVGGGLELALACDWIYATSTARFALPEPTLGLIPGFGGTRRLRDRVSVSVTHAMVLGGRELRAPDALAVGLVTETFETESEMGAAATDALGRSTRGRSRTALALARQSLLAAAHRPRDEAFARETELYGDAFATPDSRIGIRAFLEKSVSGF